MARALPDSDLVGLLRPPVDPRLKAAADACRIVGAWFVILGMLPLYRAGTAP